MMFCITTAWQHTRQNLILVRILPSSLSLPPFLSLPKAGHTLVWWSVGFVTWGRTFHRGLTYLERKFYNLSSLNFPPGILVGFSSSSPSMKSSPSFPLLHHPKRNPPLSRSSGVRPKKPTSPLPPAHVANRVPSSPPSFYRGKSHVLFRCPIAGIHLLVPSSFLPILSSPPRSSHRSRFLQAWVRGLGGEGAGILHQGARSQFSPVPVKMGLQ